MSSIALPKNAFAQTTDSTLDAERAKCMKNTAYTWNTSLNRCIQKKEAQAARHEVEDCAALTDMEQRKECHKKIAEKKTGLNSDPDSLPQGTTNQSMVMNGIASAYAIVGLINSAGSGGKTSSCTSKKIFAVTALAGTATDIWLKIKAKKAMDELKNKYQLSVKSNAHDNQSKAFEFLKEEQLTVKDIASREKTRNMLLTLGYGAAALMALFEMSPWSQNADCYKPNDKTAESKTKGCNEDASLPGCAPDKEWVCDNNPAAEGCSGQTVIGENKTPVNTNTATPAVTQPSAEATPVEQTVVTAKPIEPNYRFADPKAPSYDPGVYDRANAFLKQNGLQPAQGLPTAVKPGK